MHSKTQMSAKTKKILTGVGIGFGTVMVFLVSFILAFSLIVNPINFFTVSDASTVEENEKLKEEVQTLNDKIEHLNTTVDKYKASSKAPVPSVPATVTTPSSGTSSGSGSDTGKNNSQTTQKPQNSENTDSDAETQAPDNTETNGSDTEDSGAESTFSPDTVNSTAEQTPEDVETPITVIDISE